MRSSTPPTTNLLHPYDGKSVLDAARRRHTFRARHDAGNCCAIVPRTRPALSAMHNLMRFYRHESCGQCTPARGQRGSTYPFNRIVAGEAHEEPHRPHEMPQHHGTPSAPSVRAWRCWPRLPAHRKELEQTSGDPRPVVERLLRCLAARRGGRNEHPGVHLFRRRGPLTLFRRRRHGRGEEPDPRRDGLLATTSVWVGLFLMLGRVPRRDPDPGLRRRGRRPSLVIMLGPSATSERDAKAVPANCRLGLPGRERGDGRAARPRQRRRRPCSQGAGGFATSRRSGGAHDGPTPFELSAARSCSSRPWARPPRPRKQVDPTLLPQTRSLPTGPLPGPGRP
jgi:hypothetical protein